MLLEGCNKGADELHGGQTYENKGGGDLDRIKN